ncbi:MAG: glycosyltransferase, partial [Duncaniella sp.]|nr:glycosyltransferase [Duncaniella sp.]
AVRNASIVFFQNTANMHFFDDKHISLRAKKLLPGSGVSLKRFEKLDYPAAPPTRFVYISRILKEKGIYEYIDAARIVREKYPDTVFHVVGPFTDEYRDLLETAQKDGIIKVHGKQYDIIPFLKDSHCTIFPSFYGEGMANILLESAASGRPIITTDVPGCGEAVEDGKTGFVVKAQDAADLASKIETFMKMPDAERMAMGDEGRRKMEREFDRQIVIDAYVSEINKILQ